MEKLTTFFQNPLAFLTSGSLGFFTNWGGNILAEAPSATWQKWIGSFAEIGGAVVVLLSLICGFLAACAAIGKRWQWMKEGQTLAEVLFTDGQARSRKIKNEKMKKNETEK